jgi:nucleoside-triphosphatase
MKGRPHLLITGRPGIGKTTLIKKIIGALNHRKVRIAGFYTEELRKKAKRTGFRIVNVSGGYEGMLASVKTRTPFRIGGYWVDEGPLNAVIKGLATMVDGQSIDVLIIDEIGPMELCSTDFSQFMARTLGATHPPVVGTMKKGTLDLLEAWSVAQNVKVITISEGDRSDFFSIAESIAISISIEKRGG